MAVTEVFKFEGVKHTYTVVDSTDAATDKFVGRGLAARFYMTVDTVKQPYAERTLGKIMERFGKYVEARESK